MKKSIIICSFILIIMTLCMPVLAAYKTVTLKDLKTYLEKNWDEEENGLIKSIEIKDNSLEISLDNKEYRIFYDDKNNIFYSEDTFDNEMDIELARTKLSMIGMLPYCGFFVVAEKNGVEKEIYSSYAVENGLLANAFAGLAISDKTTDLVKELDKVDFDDLNGDSEYFSAKWEKKKENSKISLKYSLKINTEEDFALMKDKTTDYKKKQEAKEKADYKITLKVGEIYSLKLDEKPSGYSLSGSSAELSKDYKTITGKQEGITYGELYFGNNSSQNSNSIAWDDSYKTKKYIYIEVVGSNVEIEKENTITKNEVSNSTTNEELEDKNNNRGNVTSNTEKIPNAGTEFGLKNILQIVIFVSILSIVIILITNKKENN